MANEKVSIDVLIDAAESAKTVKDLKQAMKDLKNAALEVGAGEKGFEKITNAIAGAKDKLEDINDSVKSLDPGAKAGAFISLGQQMAGAFSIASGAAGLFGSKNEDVEKAILKVQSAIAILNGVQALADAKRDLGLVKGIALRGLENAKIAIATGLESKSVIVRVLATAAQYALNAAMNANPIFLLITGLIALVGAFLIFNDKSKETLAISNELTKVYGNVTDAIKRLTQIQTAAAEFQAKLGKIRLVSAKEQLALEQKVLDEKITGLEKEQKANDKFIKLKYSLLKDLSDEDRKAALDEIADTRKKNKELLQEYADFNGQKVLLNVQYVADEKKKREEAAKKEKEQLDKDNKEKADKNKAAYEQRVKDNQTLQNQIRDLENLSIVETQKREEDKLKLDAERKKKEVQALKADKTLKLEAEKKLEEDLQRQLNEVKLKYAAEGSKTKLEAELTQLETEGKSTLAKRIEILKFERDLILSSTAATAAEKAKAQADYNSQEKELFVTSLKDIDEKIKENSVTNRIAKLSEYNKALEELKKSRDEQLKVIEDAVKKEVEIATAKGLDPNQAKLDAEKKYANDRLLINEKFNKDAAKLDDAARAEKIAKFQKTFNDYAQAAQTTLNAIGDFANAADDRQKNEANDKLKSITASNDLEIKTISDRYDAEIEAAKAAGINTDALEKQKTQAVKQAEYEKALAIYNQKVYLDGIEKKAFERNKKIQIANALISGAVGAANALSAKPFFPMAALGVAMAALTTAASIAKIKSTQFEGSAGTAPLAPSFSTGGSGAGGSAFGGADTNKVGFNTGTAITGDSLKQSNQTTQKVVILQSDIKKAGQQEVRIEQKNTF